MKALVVVGVSLFFLNSLHAQTIPDQTLKNLHQLYPEQSNEFLLERIKNAPLPFNKWRSFPPYYYQMLSGTREGRKLKGRKGLCAGDSHVENFGFIYGTPTQFTVNDLDDVTPCSLDVDLMRLFIGHRMVKPDLNAEEFLADYQNGFGGKACSSTPDFIKKLEKSSNEGGRQVSKKNKKLRDSKECTGEYQKLTPEEMTMLTDFSKAENGDKSCLNSSVLSDEFKNLATHVVQSDPKVIVHACARVKDSGGSAGGRRLVVFRKWSSGEDAFELKPLQKPAPNYNVKVNVAQRQKIYETAVKLFMGEDRSHDYYPVSLTHPGTQETTLYQRRPLWAGNEEVKLSDLPKTDASVSEADRTKNELVKKEVLLYETCRLGILHARSQKKSTSFKPKEWEKMAVSIEQQFKKEFGH